MVNAIKGILISCDIPMAEFIINMNNASKNHDKFIIQILDSTHILVQPNAADRIQSQINEFRNKITYEKPA